MFGMLQVATVLRLVPGPWTKALDALGPGWHDGPIAWSCCKWVVLINTTLISYGNNAHKLGYDPWTWSLSQLVSGTAPQSRVSRMPLQERRSPKPIICASALFSKV